MNIFKRTTIALAVLASVVLVAPAADARPAKCKLVSVTSETTFDPLPTPQLVTVTTTTSRCRGHVVVVEAISYQPVAWPVS